MSSGYDLQPDMDLEGTNAEPPKGEALAKVAEAYSRLQYDLGLLTPKEATALDAAKAKAPTNFVAVKDTVTRMFQVNGQPVAVVLLPAIATNLVIPPAEELRRAIEAGKAAKSKARLVIALAPWGIAAEKALIDAAPATFDVVLGAGTGSGLGGRVESGGKTLWLRPFGKGKTMQRVDFLTWPTRDAAFVFMPDQNIRLLSQTLDEQVAEDPEMTKFFEGIK